MMHLTIAVVMMQAGGVPPQPLFSGTWQTDDDYPPAEARLGHQGTVGWRLLISASGKPTACEITQSSGFPALDDAACSMMSKHLRFRPARDDSGKAVPGTFSGRYTWKLPGAAHSSSPAVPVAARAMEVTLSKLPKEYQRSVLATLAFNPAGNVSECILQQSSGSAVLYQIACRELRQGVQRTTSDKLQKDPVQSTYTVSFRADTPAKP